MKKAPATLVTRALGWVRVPARGGSGRLEGLEFLGRTLRGVSATASVQALLSTDAGSNVYVLFYQIRCWELRSADRAGFQQPDTSRVRYGWLADLRNDCFRR